MRRGVAYLGPMGGMVAITRFSGLETAESRASVDKVTTSGVVRVQVAPRTYRQWQVTVGNGRLSEISALAALVAGEFGYGPFWFVDPWAQVTNVLAPASSVLDWPLPSGLAAGGPVVLADGARAGRSVVVADPAAIVSVHRYGTGLHRVPVVQGRPVTGSVYAAGTGSVSVRLTWWDAAGVEVSSTSFSTFTPGAQMQRLHRSATPPPGAASVSVGLRGASRFARPAVTWTDTLVDWHVGQGAPSVALPLDLAQDIVLATRDRRYTALSSTIREVG